MTIGSSEARTHFAELLRRVAAGEEITISKRGKPIARLLAPAAKKDVKKVIQEMIAYRKKNKRTLGGLTVRQLMEEGRRY